MLLLIRSHRPGHGGQHKDSFPVSKNRGCHCCLDSSLHAVLLGCPPGKWAWMFVYTYTHYFLILYLIYFPFLIDPVCTGLFKQRGYKIMVLCVMLYSSMDTDDLIWYLLSKTLEIFSGRKPPKRTGPSKDCSMFPRNLIAI